MGRTILIERNEGTAARRRVPCRIFLSDGTSPDTGALNDAVLMGVNSLTTISLTSSLRAVHAAQGMYAVELTQSETSVLGIHPLYHTVGDFPQHIATVEVVASNPYSTVSAFDPSTTSVGLKAVSHSGATVEGLTNFSNLSGTFSDFSVSIRNTGIAAASFQAGAIDAAALAAMNLSDVTVRVQPMLYSGLTVGINDAVGDMSSKFTVGVGTIAAGTYSGVTISGVQSMVSADVHRLRTDDLAVIRMVSHASSVVTGQAVTGILSTTTMTSDVAEATDDHFNDAVIVFTSGALAYQRTSITSFFGFSNGSSRFVFPALTEAPANGTTFIIV